MTFSTEINDLAQNTLEACRNANLTLATAESCTGGLIVAALTEITGSSDVVECGFVTYSNQAKYQMLGVPLEITDGSPGAVSELVARRMVEGALQCSAAGIAVAVTGIAGPGGGSVEKPVGIVYIAVKCGDQPARIEECRFGNIGRKKVRTRTVMRALEMVQETVGEVI